jgi:hypothetical protein
MERQTVDVWTRLGLRPPPPPCPFSRGPADAGSRQLSAPCGRTLCGASASPASRGLPDLRFLRYTTEKAAPSLVVAAVSDRRPTAVNQEQNPLAARCPARSGSRKRRIEYVPEHRRFTSRSGCREPNNSGQRPFERPFARHQAGLAPSIKGLADRQSRKAQALPWPSPVGPRCPQMTPCR